MQFASAYTHLVMLDISVNGLNETELSLKDCRRRWIHMVDIGDTPSLTTCLEEISSTTERIDWVVNCAGITLTSRSTDITPQQWQQILAVNLLGITTITNHLPWMLTDNLGK